MTVAETTRNPVIDGAIARICWSVAAAESKIEFNTAPKAIRVASPTDLAAIKSLERIAMHMAWDSDGRRNELLSDM